MVVCHQILSDVALYWPGIPIILGFCKVAEAMVREHMRRKKWARIWLLYLAVPAYVLFSVAGC